MNTRAIIEATVTSFGEFLNLLFGYLYQMKIIGESDGLFKVGYSFRFLAR